MISESRDQPRGEGAGITLAHAYLLLDGSGSMGYKEIISQKEKHKAVAEMVQDLVNEFYENTAISNTQLTVVCWDSGKVDDIRVRDYNVKSAMHYKIPNESGERYSKDIISLWDPLVGHGGQTPLGKALQNAQVMAKEWVNQAKGIEVRRAVIFLMSDGMEYITDPNPTIKVDPMDERKRITEFNEQQSGGGRQIRLATIGYYQYQEGNNSEEDQGRVLLKSLAKGTDWKAGEPNPPYYFENSSAAKIGEFILTTTERARRSQARK